MNKKTIVVEENDLFNHGRRNLDFPKIFPPLSNKVKKIIKELDRKLPKLLNNKIDKLKEIYNKEVFKAIETTKSVPWPISEEKYKKNLDKKEVLYYDI